MQQQHSTSLNHNKIQYPSQTAHILHQKRTLNNLCFFQRRLQNQTISKYSASLHCEGSKETLPPVCQLPKAADSQRMWIFYSLGKEYTQHTLYLHSFVSPLAFVALVVDQLFSLVMQVCFHVSDMKKICSGEEEEEEEEEEGLWFVVCSYDGKLLHCHWLVGTQLR